MRPRGLLRLLRRHLYTIGNRMITFCDRSWFSAVRLAVVVVAGFGFRNWDEMTVTLHVHAVQSKAPDQTASRWCLSYGIKIPSTQSAKNKRFKMLYATCNYIQSNAMKTWHMIRMALRNSGIGAWRHNSRDCSHVSIHQSPSLCDANLYTWPWLFVV